MIRVIADIKRRKQLLIERCAGQRASIAVAVRGLERPAALADRVLAAGRSLRSHRLLLATAVVAAVVAVALRRGTMVGLAARGVAMWRLWRTISVWARQFGLDFSRSARQQKTGHVAP